MSKFKKGPKCPYCWGKGYDYHEKELGAVDCYCPFCFGTGIQDAEEKDNHELQGLRLGHDE